MNKTTLLIAASSALTFAYAVAVTHVPDTKASDAIACGGDSDAKKKKSDKKGEEKS